MTAWTVVVGLVVYAAIWLTVGFTVGVRRHRDPVARWDHATAMRNAPPPTPPPELARLDTTAPDQSDATLALPELNNETIAIGAPTVSVAEMAGAFQGAPDSVTWLRDQRGGPTEPAEPLQLPAPPPTSLAPQSYHTGTAATEVSTWRPPDPRVVLAIAWHRPDGAPTGRRWDITDRVEMPNNQTAPNGELGVKQMWQTLDRQSRIQGGTVKVTVTADGHPIASWSDQPWDTWSEEAVPVIRQARKTLEHV